ncbi:MAG: lysylphosphatidylglycerol synthase transmembrane domain-containing protein [Halothece sp. Uz-M2-17]|nr:lysylphosphatidylglycerol synthase transmembrane domain-containing protein [Halothece sp. Uz-M2-17]
MKKIISIALSLIILIILYLKIDFTALLAVFEKSHRGWMMGGLGMVIPITMLTAWRLQQLTPKKAKLTFGEGNRLILAASVLNMVLPSKMGDIAKAYFIQKRGSLTGSLALSLVIFEKTCDLLSLLFWCGFGLFLYPDKGGLFWGMTVVISSGLILGILLLSSRSFADTCFNVGQHFAPKTIGEKLEKLQTAWGEMHDYFWRDRAQLLLLTFTSIFLWFLHLFQIWLFILALKAWTPVLVNLALAPLAILAGLLPLTFAGIGTRDAALVFFYNSYLDPPTAAALGLLCTSRYFIPAVAGFPFMGRYLSK